MGLFFNIKDVESYQKELREDYIITKELSNLTGNLALKYGKFLSLANFGLITTKHIDFTHSEAGEHAHRKDAEEIPEQPSAVLLWVGLQSQDFSESLRYFWCPTPRIVWDGEPEDGEN